MGKAELKIEIDAAIVAEAERLGVDLSMAGLAGVELALARRRSALKTDAERAADARAWAAGVDRSTMRTRTISRSRATWPGAR